MSADYSSREDWLHRAVEMFRPKFDEIGHPLPTHIRIAVGFSPTGAKFEGKTILGVTLKTWCAADNVNEVWVSPEDADTTSMLATVLHELIHVSNDCDDGAGGAHKGRFAEAAKSLGFEAPMTSTPPSVELQYELLMMAKELGEYPGAQVNLKGVFGGVGPEGDAEDKPSSGPGKQKARMLKAECKADEEANCFGYTVRLAKKWIDVGLPHCPNWHEMELD